MERLLLYWDNLDDLAGAAALKLEALRRLCLRMLKTLGLVAFGVLAMSMAAAEPEFGLASLTLLFVALFYRRVTSPSVPPAHA
jgi:hypothetical protein